MRYLDEKNLNPNQLEPSLQKKDHTNPAEVSVVNQTVATQKAAVETAAVETATVETVTINNDPSFVYEYTKHQQLLVSRAKRLIKGPIKDQILGLENFLILLRTQPSDRPLYRDQATIGKIYHGLYLIVTKFPSSSGPLTINHNNLDQKLISLAQLRNSFNEESSAQSQPSRSMAELEQRLWGEVLEWIKFYIKNATYGLETLDFTYHKVLELAIKAADHCGNYQDIIDLSSQYLRFRTANFNVHRSLCKAYFHCQDYKQAKFHGLQLLKRTDTDVLDIYRVLSISSHHLEDHRGSIRYGQKFIQAGGNVEDIIAVTSVSHQALHQHPHQPCEESFLNNQDDTYSLRVAFEIASKTKNSAVMLASAERLHAQGIVNYRILEVLFIHAYMLRNYDEALEYLNACLNSINTEDEVARKGVSELIGRMLEISSSSHQWEDFEYWSNKFLEYSDSKLKHQIVANCLARNEQWERIIKFIVNHELFKDPHLKKLLARAEHELQNIIETSPPEQSQKISSPPEDPLETFPVVSGQVLLSPSDVQLNDSVPEETAAPPSSQKSTLLQKLASFFRLPS